MIGGQLPKVARPSQPWALGRNPVGIQVRSATVSGRPAATRGKRETVGKFECGLRVRVAVRKHLRLGLREQPRQS